MNIHYKNMKQIAQDMEQWTQANLAPLGIYECGFTRYDLKTSTFLGLPSMYDWYCEYLSNGFDALAADRIENNLKPWHASSNGIQSHYFNYISQQNMQGHRFDWVKKNDSGYEILAIGCNRPLNLQDMHLINKKFHELAYHVTKISRQKPNSLLELKDHSRLLALHSAKINHSHEFEY